MTRAAVVAVPDAAPPVASARDAGRDQRLVAIERTLSEVDQIRRLLARGDAPLTEVYLEGARGCLHHARDALLRALRDPGVAWSLPSVAGASVEGRAGERLCQVRMPAGWRDEVLPARPDLGADLFASDRVRERSRSRLAAAMLGAALADHVWLHVASGTSWSTDRSGAMALVSALTEGRPIDLLAVEVLDGSLDGELVRDLAGLGWRRLRSPAFQA